MEKISEEKSEKEARVSSGKKTEIEQFLAEHREEIETEQLIVLFVDECHLVWGDICGYVWGKTSSRVEVPIKNEKQRQSYYGAINYRTGTVTLKRYSQGNTENTIKFVKYLIEQNRGAKLVIIWDGATYHYSQEFREYLKTVHQGKPKEQWLIRCIKLAPNAPEQNPIEDVWLQGKEMLRRYWNLCKNFRIVKWLFEWTISQDCFCFPKLSMYGSFS